MGNNGGKYNINKKKNLYMGGKTNQKKNNGRNESHHKKEKTKSVNIIPNLSASQT